MYLCGGSYFFPSIDSLTLDSTLEFTCQSVNVSSMECTYIDGVLYIYGLAFAAPIKMSYIAKIRHWTGQICSNA